VKESQKRHPEPPKGTTKEPPNKYLDVPVALANPEFREAWLAWLLYRRERKAPMTPSTYRRQMAAFEKHGVARSIAAIHRAIQSGWVGVFPDREPDESLRPGGSVERGRRPPPRNPQHEGGLDNEDFLARARRRSPTAQTDVDKPQ
jgi:hypothetical protein